MQKRPIVSVIVLSYNSSSTILDTLNSIKEQTYDNIELIIADDKSKDNSVEICKNWLADNKGRFTYCEVVVPPENTGTSANCNRGIEASHGEWIFLIAGDDMLFEHSIKKSVDYVHDNPDVKVFVGSFVPFKTNNQEVVYLKKKTAIDIAPFFFKMDAVFQYKYLLYNTRFGLSQGGMIKRDVFEKVCKYEEKYTIIEDYPFWLNITKAGVKIHYCDENLKKYRIHESVSLSSANLISPRFETTFQSIIHDKVLPCIPKYDVIYFESYWIDNLRIWISLKILNNRKNFITKLFYYSIRVLRLLDYRNFILDIYYKKRYGYSFNKRK